MPQLANLILTDRAATPVNHTFTPAGIAGNVATVVESTGVPVGDNKVTLSWTTTSAGRRKATLRYTFPQVQTQVINGVSTPVVVRTAFAEVSFSFDPTSSEAERNNAVGMVLSSLESAKALVNDTIVKLQGVY